MPTPFQYMQFSLGVYASSVKNYIDPAAGWTLTDWQPDQQSGFSADCYVNGSEVVISYTGTNGLADKVNCGIEQPKGSASNIFLRKSHAPSPTH